MANDSSKPLGAGGRIAPGDSEDLRQTIQLVMWPILGTALAYMLVSIVFLSDNADLLRVTATASLVLVGLTIFARIGPPRLVAHMIIVFLLAVATYQLVSIGGLAAPGQGVYVIAILVAAALLGLRAAVATTLLSIASTGGIAWLEAHGGLPATPFGRDPLIYWLAQVATFTAVSGSIWIVLQRIQSALADARESEAMHRMVAEGAGEFIWKMTPDGRFEYASPAAKQILGFDHAEMLARRALPEQFAPGSPDVRTLIGRAVGEGRDVLQFEAQQRRKDGSYVWCEITVTLLRDDDGKLASVTGVTRDISAQKRSDEERHRLEVQLQQSQKMEAIGQLAGGIAHDFNNYLTVILGNLEILGHKSGADPDSPLSEIESAARRSAELTRQLLAFSRKQLLKPAILDLNRVILDADRLLDRVLGEDIVIETHCEPNLGRVRVDPAQLDQIILNLAVNARSAMPEGGRLQIETGHVELDEEFCRAHPDVEPGRFVMLVVSDDGVGMDEATRARIFEPFFTTRESGSGLGLSTVHGIVKQSGGAVEVHSALGKGTAFRIYFPRLDRPADAVTEVARTARAGRPAASETVLVVEDQPMVQRLILGLLEPVGYRVLIAADRPTALEIVDRDGSDLDLLLTDIVLPDANGAELANEITTRVDIPVVYMSGFAEASLIQKGNSGPERPLIQKPFTAGQLERAIRQALDG